MPVNRNERNRPQPLDGTPHVNNQDDSGSSQRRRRQSSQYARWAAFMLALSCGCFHVYHVSSMFENDRHFSHLSSLEREMCFRTEMGLYYSYYKRIVEAPNVLDGLMSILKDNVTEFPDTVNLFHRFNVVPEAILGLSFRVYKNVMDSLSIQTKQCFTVERGGGRPPVRSCEGLGEPIYFYLEGVWLCAGLTAFSLFMYSYSISNSLFGGCLSMLCFFYNHGESTRIQWAPALRESFAYPFVLQHCLTVTRVLDESRVWRKQYSSLLEYMTLYHNGNMLLKKEDNSRNGGKFSFAGVKENLKPIMIGMTSYFMLLFWQFSQFILACEVAIFLFMYYIGNIERKTLHVLVVGLTVSQLFALTGLLANELLLSSFLSVILVVAWLNILLNYKTVRHSFSVWSISCLILSAILCILLKKFIPSQDDAHIINIFLSKVMSIKEDFHTLMYTCSPEFRRLPWSYVLAIFESYLIPLVVTSLYCVFLLWLQRLSYYTKLFAPMKELFTPPVLRDMPISCVLQLHGSQVAQAGDGRNVQEAPEAVGSGTRQKKPQIPKCAMNLLDPEIVYNIGLLVAYTFMASMIMRLKLFLTPHMCIITSLLASKKVMRPILKHRTHRPFHYALLCIIVASISVPGFQNLNKQRNIQGEYSNYPLEELLLWVKSHTPPKAVFAGPMPTMANLLLSTGRPIVNHPHYENAKLRERTKKVYSLFSRKSVDEVHRLLQEMGVDYAVLEQGACLDFKRPVTGCKMTDLWDAEDPGRRDNSVLCPQLFYNNPAPFHRVFSNSEYVVLAVKISSVEIRPNVVSAPL